MVLSLLYMNALYHRSWGCGTLLRKVGQQSKTAQRNELNFWIEFALVIAEGI